MALTAEDLKNIENVVDNIVTDKVDKIVDNKLTKLKVDLDRMETRIISSIGLVERDSFNRIDEHERRIAKLEQAVAAR